MPRLVCFIPKGGDDRRITNLGELPHAYLVTGFELTQETVDKGSVFIVNAASVSAEKLGKKGAEKVVVRHLIDERQGSDRFALRLYSLEEGGHTPLDRHVYEHQVYVLSGEGLLKQAKDGDPVLRTLHKSDTVFIPSYAAHQFINERKEPFVFLCVKGNPAIYPGDKNEASDDSARNFC